MILTTHAWKVSVAGGAVAARAMGALTLIVAARYLDHQAFGVFALAFSLSAAMTGLLGGGLLDGLTYARLGDESRRHLRKFVALLSATGLVGVVVTMDAPRVLAVLILATTLGLTGLAPLVAGGEARARDELLAASILTFWAPVAFRLAALLLFRGHSAVGLLQILASAAALAGFVSIKASSRGADSSSATVPSAVSSRRGIVTATLAVAAMWAVLGQLDVWALGLFKGALTVADYVPEMRLFEAATAVIAIVTFGASRRLTGIAAPARLALRLACQAAGLYAIVGILILVVGPTALSLLFDRQGHFDRALGVGLMSGYAAASAAAIYLQRLFSLGRYWAVARVCASTLTVALLIIPGGAASQGEIGAAWGNALSYASVLLFAKVYSREPRMISHLR